MVTGPLAENSLHLLQMALRWWQARGFQFVDLPWLVPQEYSDATRPSFCRDIATPYGSFVASGEQSFLQLRAEGRLPAGIGFIGWTPCLRDEAQLDELHQHGFMKVEWYVPLNDLKDMHWVRTRLVDLIAMQKKMFSAIALAAGWGGPLNLGTEVFGSDQIDLSLAGVEIGSYGVREFRGMPYIYGTALALPRFQQALERYSGMACQKTR